MSDLPDMTAPSPFDAAGNLIAPPMPQDFDALHALLAPALPQPQPDIPLPPIDTTLRAPAAESVAGPPTSAAELETPGVATPPAQSVAPSGPVPQPYGAELAAPTAAGPPVAGVKDLTDVTTEAPTPGATQEERDFNAATTPEEREAAYNKLSPDQQDRVLTGEAERYANLPPEQRAKVDALREGVRLEKLNKGLLDAATADTKKAQENYAIYQKAQTDVRQRRQALQQQIEQLGQFKPQGIGVGQAIAGIVASVVGGFASPFTGGRNLGLEGFHKAIDMHAQEQRDEYERQRLALGAKQQLLNADEDQTQADFRTNEAQRALANEQLIRQLQAEAQNYDPRSTTVARIGQKILDTRVQQAAALDALDQRNLKNTIDTAKAQAEVEEKRSAAQKNMAETLKITGKLGGAGAGAGKDTYTPEQLQALYKSQGVDIPLPPKPMTLAEHEKLMGAVGKARESQTGEAATTVQGPGGKPLEQEGQVLRVPAEEAGKVNDAIGYTQNFVNVLGDARRLLAGDPSLIDRGTWAEISTKFEKAKTQFIKSVGANPSSREMQAVEEMFGPNFEGYKDRLLNRRTGLRRIDSMLDSAKEDVGTQLRQKLRYTGPSVINDTSRPNEHVPTIDEHDMKELLAPPLGGVSGSVNAEDLATLSRGGGMTDAQRLILDDLGRRAGTQDGRADAVKRLDEAMRESQTPAVQSYAAQLLHRAGVAPRAIKIGGE